MEDHPHIIEGGRLEVPCLAKSRVMMPHGCRIDCMLRFAGSIEVNLAALANLTRTSVVYLFDILNIGHSRKHCLSRLEFR